MYSQETLKENSPIILVVDDNANDLTVIRAMLEKKGWRVEEAMNGVEALDKITAAPVHLILSDIAMPGVDGFQLCETVKKNSADRFIPVILMTGYLDPENHTKALAVGVDEFLEKPIIPSILTTRIQSLLKMKELYERVENDFQKVRATEKLKEDMIQMMAHDMKNPLTAIRGYSELMLTSKAEFPEEKVQDFLRKIILGSDDLMRMILNFLGLSKMEAGKCSLNLSRFDFKETVDRVVGKIRPLLEKSMRNISVQVEPSEYWVEGDHELIERVMMNLIDNAVKYSPEGTEVVVALTCPASNVQFSVKDQGPGIPPEFHEKIFEKFNRVRDLIAPFKTDTGLGLAFCKMAVEMHHGKIWVLSASGKGSCFSFVIPIRQPREEKPPTPAYVVKSNGLPEDAI